MQELSSHFSLHDFTENTFFVISIIGMISCTDLRCRCVYGGCHLQNVKSALITSSQHEPESFQHTSPLSQVFLKSRNNKHDDSSVRESVLKYKLLRILINKAPKILSMILGPVVVLENK